MLILIRALVAAAALLARLGHFVFRPLPKGHYQGLATFLRLQKNKGQITGVSMGISLRGPVVFRLTRESGIDRFFKWAGISEEIEAQNEAFDRVVYVACDHPFFASLLKKDGVARQRILESFHQGFDRIWTEGKVLWIRRKASEEPDEEDWRRLWELRQSIEEVESHLAHQARDPFLWRALFVEALTWSIGGYALASFLEYSAIKEDYHVSTSPLISMGLGFAALLFFALIFLIGLLLRTSSRSHRILVEGVFLLALGLPITGIQLVSDLNRGLDRAPASTETRVIRRVEKRQHRSRRGRTWYSYHLHLDPAALPPTEIQVSEAVWRNAAPDKTLELVLGPGWLGLPWYREMRVR